MSDPLISVVMPVYNGERYVIDAVASILGQTLSDWELICVNDGSRDRSPQILDWFARQDARIHVRHQANAGIVAALNTGCAAATAPLICRMDCDDIALPDRLQKQSDFLRRHPNCTVVGGGILEIDAEGDPLQLSRLPSEHAAIVDNLLHRRTGHFHPTTMMRAEALEAVGGYRSQYQWVEDHDLWLRLAQRGRLANLPEPVLCYRQHQGSVCWQRSAQQRELMNALLKEAYAARGQAVPSQVIVHQQTQRAPAGPGKWARMAAKGGFTRSVRKHLRQLWAGPTPRTYKLRMTLEVTSRLALRLLTRRLRGETPLAVPRFDQWQTRFAESGEPDNPVAGRRLAA